MSDDRSASATLTEAAKRLAAKTVTAAAAAPSPARKSRRLSGKRPDFSLLQAEAAVNSPRRSRRNSLTGSEDGGDRAEAAEAVIRVPEPIAEEEPDLEEEEEKPKAKPHEHSPEKQKQDSAVSTVEKGRPSAIPRGRCKSGRFWKSERDRFRSVIKSKGLKQSLEQRRRQKEARDRARGMEAALREERLERAEDLKRRRADNKRKREENERRAEVVQKVKNPAKLKRMKKKQLRQLAKRDTTVVQKAAEPK